ncbi:hypothetical protein Pmani_021487 [Petrolisthes manimaculis]|uniref:Essential for reactive oxygen species protein n=1 Tax=Petrolisthes manimaculis TaxID=1843537 RepID=A0AAE1PEW3_9EUCA|nr:hypothetical protein Pmani_021487 [Petrolisthes manimaculis]
MNVELCSTEALHLSVAPGVKSWSILVGILSFGVGAAYYSPDEHVLMKAAVLTGCLILGLTFLDDWEDCVFDKGRGQVTMTRRSWWEWLTSRCSQNNTLIFDTSSIMAIRVMPAAGRLRNGHQVVLVLRAGGTVPISETKAGCKSEQEDMAKRVRTFLCLDRVEAVNTNPTWEMWTDTDESDDNLFHHHPPVQVESLKGSGNLNFDEVKIENENYRPMNEDTDSEISSEDESYDDLHPE